MPTETSTASLRSRLREATQTYHDKLDSAFDPEMLGDRETYAAFLACQLAARAPIEAWARSECPAALVPPPVTALLIEDLHDLGRPFSHRPRGFSLPAGADPLGLAWVIAGSHLGNRFMLKRLQDAGSDLPNRFLSDPAMTAYWQALRPQLEAPSSEMSARPAVEAAICTFRFFQRAFVQPMRKAAA